MPKRLACVLICCDKVLQVGTFGVFAYPLPD
jgi:hypothetical protein